MRLAWLTPLNFGSGVSRFSLSVVRALRGAEGVDVDVWYPQTDGDFDCPWAPARPLEQLSDYGLDNYDAFIYNLGNHADNHAAIYERYRRTRGVVVLHDKVMQGFFFGYANDIRKEPLLYACLMRYVYGAEAGRFALDGLLGGASTAFWDEAGTRFPLFEPCLWNASGVVTHSSGAKALGDGRYPGLLPSVELELPYFIYDDDSADGTLSRVDLGIPADRVLLVSTGRFGAQKRLDITMNAIAADPELKAKAYLAIAGGGDQEYLDYLRGVSRRLGVGDLVRFFVDPDDPTLHSLVALADIAVNLRHPSTESASASLIEQLYFGKPAIVSKIGVYDEFPDDVVIKVGLDDEQAALGEALRSVVLDAAHRADVAALVRTYAASHFSADVYAKRLVAFVTDPRVTGGMLGRVDARAVQLRGEPASRLTTRADEVALELISE